MGKGGENVTYGGAPNARIAIRFLVLCKKAFYGVFTKSAHKTVKLFRRLLKSRRIVEKRPESQSDWKETKSEIKNGKMGHPPKPRRQGRAL